MAAVTPPEQHGPYPAMTFHQERDRTVNNTLPPASEVEMPENPTHLPTRHPSPGLSSSGPPPNPHFVFPARPSPSSAPSSLSRATGRMPRSTSQEGIVGFGRETRMGAGRPQPPPLPNFSFSQTTLPQPSPGLASPPLSPQSPTSSRAIASRPGGHRRGGSEFIGGDGMTGTGLGLMSTSPTKGDGVLPSPTSQSVLGSSTVRRGHAHRRSAAISCHDISLIVKPTSPTSIPVGGSAPTSPSGDEEQQTQLLVPSHTDGTNTLSITTPTRTERPHGLSGSPPRAANKNRVGFSDTVEFIPRPLSLVSSDASSTATMLPGHSVSNSLSSLMSAGATSPPSKGQRGFSSPVKNSEARPSTAGAILGGSGDSMQCDSSSSSLKRRNSVQLTGDESAKVSDSASIPRLLPKKYFFFGLDMPGGESSPTRSRPASSGSPDKQRSAPNHSLQSAPEPASQIAAAAANEDPASSRRPSVTRKPSKKQKKVRSWAGSILSRKPRQRSQKQKALSRRSPTPPLRSFEPLLENAPDYEPRQDNSVPTTAGVVQPSSLPNLQTSFTSWKPRQVRPHDDDSMSPIIDLDAALGPFKTPSGYDPDWEASQKKPGHPKRRMHSAAGANAFVGPFHRRAESAPEMVAFENPRFGLQHIGGRSTMEDVFEEDEEDDWEETNTVSRKGSKNTVQDEESSSLGNDTKDVDAEDMTIDGTMDGTPDDTWNSQQRGVKRKCSGLSEEERRQTFSGNQTGFSAEDWTVFREEKSDIEVAYESGNSRPASASKSLESTPTPPLRPHVPQELAPFDNQTMMSQAPFLTPSSFNSTNHSSFPSPRSPISYDTQRISTAPSSLNDEQGFQSLLLGEPGPELRMSVDDVPSLTSSNSTMTRESAINPGFNNPHFRTGQRSASLSAPSVNRKRSSIASLSRLLNSSHGEKSKLSIEESAPSSPEKKGKEGKAKRFSRLMQFWKPKEASDS